MNRRVAMNSLALQEAFPDVYRKLFAKCPIVVSAPTTFVWSGEYTTMYGGPSITQTLPMRVYVGLEPISQSEIRYGIYEYFNPSRQTFEHRQDETILQEPIVALLHQELAILTGNSPSIGFVLHVLSEAPAGHGLQTSGALSAALATALHLQFGALATTTVVGWPTLPLDQLSAQKAFDRVFRLAWKIEAIHHAGVASGRDAFVPFVSSLYPVVYFTEHAIARVTAAALDERQPTVSAERVETLNSLRYWGFRLDEFYDLKLPPYWPIDFGLIYSGYDNDTTSVMRFVPFMQADIQQVGRSFGRQLVAKLGRSRSKGLKLFTDRLLAERSAVLRDRIIDTLGIVTMSFSEAFHELIRRSHTQEHLHAFVRSINHYQDVLRILQTSTPTIDHICFLLLDKARRMDVVSGVGAKLTGGGHGGDVLFAAPIGVFRKSAEELVKELQSTLNAEIQLDYASWIDGYGKDGIRIEQQLEAQRYSPFVSVGTVYVRHLNEQGHLHTDLYTKEEFESLRATDDVIFDAVKKEITVRGERLTSSELHSTSATIQLMQYLIERPDQAVKNSQLPDSSYARDRNELQSKILSPLLKAVQARTDRVFPIAIHGGLTDFTVTLTSKQMEVEIVSKVF